MCVTQTTQLTRNSGPLEVLGFLGLKKLTCSGKSDILSPKCTEGGVTDEGIQETHTQTCLYTSKHMLNLIHSQLKTSPQRVSCSSQAKEFQYYAKLAFCIHKSVFRETNICYFVQTHIPVNRLILAVLLLKIFGKLQNMKIRPQF